MGTVLHTLIRKIQTVELYKIKNKKLNCPNLNIFQYILNCISLNMGKYVCDFFILISPKNHISIMFVTIDK